MLPNASFTIINLINISFMTIIYFRLIFFIRNQIPQFSQAQRRIRAQRDLVVARRIIFTIIAMTLPGLPNIGFIFLSNIHPNMEGSYEMYRIQWTGPILAFLVLNIALILMTPSLKHLIIGKMLNQRAQVQPATLNTAENGRATL
ncbi:unnamed protein product [Rotaria magnacalcarata]|uniref:Uncharacterized protein n=1 Tax=Rotaria magnacalcarata TaxID=392030 RepID=A0A816A6R7_9BILA|nr:unnamed protein product [Rotaria magnacalcarata]CAF3751251.1 unnamed protein product [Rotaria magnacalcarata]CAF3751503.1 unnamed protein product [Rotaria magnacalcarata]CAF3787542.1 unnamed protein product [Rotaria magnacalcarata]CAF3790796.1 unnamed protein product [Rotaria magnacalcarata]